MSRDFHDHPDWQAMFLALAEDPLNPVRRLVMADWLDEFGTEDAAARAAVIRIAHHPDWPADGVRGIDRTPGDRWAQDPDGTVVWVPNRGGEQREAGSVVAIPQAWADRFGCRTYRVAGVERRAGGGILPGRAKLFLSPLPVAGQLNEEWIRALKPAEVKEWIRRETEWDIGDMHPLHAANEIGVRDAGFFSRFLNGGSPPSLDWITGLVQRMPLVGFASWFADDPGTHIVSTSDVEGDWVVRLDDRFSRYITGNYRTEVRTLGISWPAFRSRRRAAAAGERAIIDAARHVAGMNPLAWPELPPDEPEPVFGRPALRDTFAAMT